MIGGGIIVSSIYRCSSGAVPPWAIEYLQDILKALFHACGGTDPFLSILFAGTDLKLKEDCRYGVIAGGGKLAGFYYDKIKPRSKDEFIRKVTETCLCKDNTKWRKLKVLIKAVCGKDIRLVLLVPLGFTLSLPFLFQSIVLTTYPCIINRWQEKGFRF